MGFKTSLYAVGPGVPRLDVRAHAEGGVQAATDAVRQWFPDAAAEPLGSSTLMEGGYPDEDSVWVATFGPTTVFGGLAPSLDGQRIGALATATGLTTWELNIHSVVDLCQFEVRTEDGRVQRRLLMTSDMPPAEVSAAAVGQPLPFEVPYWAGEHPLADPGGGAHPFHPLELGEAALAWMFGTYGEGAPPDDVQRGLGELTDPEEVPMYGFGLGHPGSGWARPPVDASPRRGLLSRLFG